MKMTGYGMGISEEHARLLADSGISPEVAAARQYRSADTKSHLKSLGFKSSQQRVPGLLLPVWSAVRHEIANWQLRSDLPRVDARGRAIKYETVADRSMVLDAHPHIWDQVGDPSVPLFITEGIRKADAAISAGVCCVALLGVWNWRGRNEQNGKTALPDWEAVALNGRDVYVVFDSDVMTKPEVHQALTRLRAFLEAK